MFKKLSAILLSGILTLSLCGCDTNEKPSTGSDSGKGETHESKLLPEDNDKPSEKEDDTPAPDGYSAWTDEEGRVWINEIPDEETVTLINTYKGKPVYGIDTQDQDFSKLKHLVIPNGITEISYMAFYGCEQLESVEIGDGMEEIGESAFCECKNLKTVKLANSIKNIRANAFMYSSIETLQLPSDIERVERLAFWNESLKSITIDNGKNYKVNGDWIVSTDGTELLCHVKGWDKSRLTGKFVIPSNITKIGTMAFVSADGLTEIEVPDNVKVIDEGAFADCEQVTTLHLPEQMDSIGKMAFRHMASLKSLRFPAVPVIAENVTENCYTLETLEFVPNDNDVVIESGAVYGNNISSDIILPKGVSRIEDGALHLDEGGDLIIQSPLEYFTNSSVSIRKSNKIVYCGREDMDKFDIAFECLLKHRQTPENGAQSAVNMNTTKGEINIGGIKFHIFDPVNVLINAGWKLKLYDWESDTVGPGRYNDGILLHGANDEVINITAYNPTDNTLPISECVIGSIRVDYTASDNISYDGVVMNQSTREDITKLFGYPDEMYRGRDKSSKDYTYTFAVDRSKSSLEPDKVSFEFNNNTGKVQHMHITTID